MLPEQGQPIVVGLQAMMSQSLRARTQGRLPSST